MNIALVGNQNCGKTTLFNALTGSNQHVGNFPGVTVDWKAGEIKGVKNCVVTDLPGIYSIRPYTNEEIVTCDFIIEQNPDAVIDIVDAMNIERNLYLTLQLLELRKPTVIALNMMDELRANGGSVDIENLSKELGVPVVPISAAKEEGISDLIATVIEMAKKKRLPQRYDFCLPGPVHRCIHAVAHIIEDHAQLSGIPARFATIEMILKDSNIQELLKLDQNELETIDHHILEMENERGLDAEAAIADMRYNFIENVCMKTVSKPRQSKERARSEKIDRILTDRFLAIPVFILIMEMIFSLTFDVIGPFLEKLLALGIARITDLVDRGLNSYGINPVVHSLIIDGIFNGVGGVLSFMPIIVTLFFFLSLLEDTGYMARVAFVMDKLLRKIGLSGKSIVPMLVGFGCTVPAVMSSRVLSSQRDKKITVMLIPFISCSAKLPIYAFFTAAFFNRCRGLIMTGLYFTGILLAIAAALILSRFVFTGKPSPFVMELPNYRLPSLKSVVLLMWEKAKDYLQKAFSVIFVATIIIWFMQTFDSRINTVTDSSMSLLASLGRMLEPVFEPVGFGDWRAATALISGFIAKEAVVSTLQVLMASSSQSVTALFTPLSALSYLVFVLLYTPCVAAVATIRRELNSYWMTVLIVVVQCVIAWLCAYGVYHLAGILL